jgi:hypothetical protein
VGEATGDAYREVSVGFRDIRDGLEIEALAPLFNFIRRIRREISEWRYPTDELLVDVFASTIICDADLASNASIFGFISRDVPRPSVAEKRQLYRSLSWLVKRRAGFIDRVLGFVHEEGHSVRAIMEIPEMVATESDSV